MTGTLDGRATATPVEHVDVLIVGAGISGIGAAYHLQEQCPAASFVVLEAKDELRRHVAHAPLSRASAPTATSTRSATASSRGRARRSPRAEEILKYMGEVIEENDLGRHIRYRHKITSATLVERGQPAGRSWPRAPTRRGARFTAELPLDVPGLLPPRRGLHARVAGHGPVPGRIVHPQTWPEDLDYRGKEVIVIGSGATTATLDAGDRRGRPSTSRCSSARRPTSAPAPTPTSWPTRCASSTSTRPGSTRSSAARCCTTRKRSPDCRSSSPSWCATS